MSREIPHIYIFTHFSAKSRIHTKIEEKSPCDPTSPSDLDEAKQGLKIVAIIYLATY